MAQLELDAFEAWVRETMRGCNDADEINAALEGEFDIAGDGDFIFKNFFTQGQWAAWQAASQARVTLRDMDSAPNNGTPILVRLERVSLGSLWQIASIRPNVTIVGHVFGFDCPPMVGWLPLPFVAESESSDATE